MGNNLVKEQYNWCSVSLSQIKPFHSHAEDILMIRSGQSYNGMIPMCPPSGLIDITLAYVSRQASRGSSSLNIDYQTRDFGHNCKTQSLLFKGKPWTTGCGHDFAPGQRSPDY